MTPDISSIQYSVDSIYSNVSYCVSNYPISESLSTEFQNIVENNSYEYVSTYVRLLTTTILLLTNYTTQHTLTQTKMDVN